MNDKQLQAANTHNLTQLWRCMGVVDSGATTSHNIGRSESWPRRLWLDWEHAKEDHERLLELAHVAVDAVIPLWPPHVGSSPLAQSLHAAGYRIQFEQTAMVLELTEESAASTEMNGVVEPLTHASDIPRWTSAASVAFQYTIDPEVILRAFNDPRVTLLSLQIDGEIAGTGLLFDEAAVLGVHQVGVLPAFRRRGIARQLMLHAIAAGHQSNKQHLTLQASALGLGLYQQLGFTHQFNIQNYSHPAEVSVETQ